MKIMKFVTKTAIAAALATLAFSASAMTPIQDADLSTVSGQDGVSIAANLNINIGSFVYTDTDATGGSVAFNNIGVKGLLAASIDIINAQTFAGAMIADGVNLLTNPSAVPANFYNGTSDVVQIAIPNVDTSKLLNVSVGSITMGSTGAAGSVTAGATGPSFGSVALNNIDLRGTTVYIWAH
jgi:hypothetical protein